MKSSSAILNFSRLLMLASLIGCHNRHRYYVGPTISGLSFTANAEVVGPARDTLSVTVDALNGSNEGVSIEFNPCAGLSQLVVKADRKHRTWDSRVWEAQRLQLLRDTASRRIEEVCVGGVPTLTLPPGKAYTYSLRTPFSRILGDSLAQGIYQITALLEINGRTIKSLKAGEIDISHTR
jgi:hypothetical protein